MKTLVICNGDSAKELIPIQSSLPSKYDEIIICNRGFVQFDSIATAHVVGEKTMHVVKNGVTIYSNKFNVADILNAGNYSMKLPRYINYKGLGYYDKRYNLIPIIRKNHKQFFSMTSWMMYKKSKVLLEGPECPATGQGLGTVLLQAVHLASLFGSNEVDIYGADLYFKSDADHFYGGRVYRDGNISSKHVVTLPDGNRSLDYYVNSAKWLSDNLCKTFSNMKITDYSKGLLKL